MNKFLTWLQVGVLVLFAASTASAQTFVRLYPDVKSGVLNATTTSIVMTNEKVGGFGSVKIQTVDSYSGTWEVRCSLDGTNYDADNQLKLILVDTTTTVYSVTDTIGIWDVTNAAGCKSIKVIETAGFTVTDTTLIMSATEAGGGSGGGGDVSLGDVTVDLTSTNNLLTAVQKGEDTAHVSGDMGTMALAVRNDTASTTLTSANGDYSPVAVDNKGQVFVTGTVAATESGTWNVTNISGTVSLPTGASTSAKQPTLGTAGTASTDVISVQGIASMTPILATVTGNLTNISGTISLPTGAATSAKQPALGTAGTASSDVISVQGIASGTALNVSLAAETTKVLGVVRIADGSGNLLASNANGGTRAIAAVIYDASGNAVTAFSGSGGTASNFGSAVPSAGTAAGFSDGTNMQLAKVVDADTGAGTVYTLTTNSVFRASGTPVEAGTSSNPWNVVFPSAQAVTQSGTWNVTNVSGTVSLPTGASTSAKQPALGTAGTASTDVISVQGIASMTPLLATLSGTNNIATVTTLTGITNALPSGSNVIGHVIVDTTSTTAVTQATASNLNAQVVGAAASGASKAGNPVQVGGVYNSTQPTVTTGQAVEVQSTARGAQIVSTGVDTFNVTVNAALPAGTAVIGHVINDASSAVIGHVIADSGSTTAVTGTVAVTESGTWTVQPGNTANTTAWLMAGGKTTNAAVPGATNLGVLGYVANATAPTLTETYLAAGSVDLHGSQRVTLLDAGGTAITPSTDYTHDAALTVASTAGPVGILRASAAAPTNVSADDDAVLPWALRNGSQVVNLASGGTLLTGTGSSLNVNVTGGSTGNGAASNTGSGVPTQADYVGLNVGGTLRGQTGLNPSGSIYTAQTDITTFGGVAPVAHDAAASSVLPMLTGCYASQAAPTDVSADTDATRDWCLRNGSRVVNLAAGGTLITATSSSLNVAVTAALPAGSNVIGHTIADTGSTTVVTGTVTVGGVAATDAAVSGNPVFIAGRASAAVPTDMSADGDVTPLWLLRSGAVASQPTYAGVLAVAGNGAAGTGVQRVTIANDSTGIIALTTGSAQIGHLEANQSSNIAQINGVTPLMGNGASGTGAQRVTIANDSTGILAQVTLVPTVTTVSTVTNLSQLGGVAIAMNTGVRSTGTQRVTIATDDVVPASQSGTWTMQPGNTANTTPWLVTTTPGTTGGWTSLNATAADGATACTNSAQVIKGSAGTFGGYFINNPNTADSWLHIYNVAAASVTVGTTNPALTFRIPGQAANSVGANLEIANGINFGTAMSMACTSTAAVNGAPTNALEADIWYK